MKASLSNHQQSPRKTRLVADMIRGKSVLVARDSLAFLAKKSAPEMLKLLESAIANARSQGQNPENLIVKKVAVDKGKVFRRFAPKARGRAGAVRKIRSHIVLELGAANVKAPKESARKSAKAKSTTSKATSSKLPATS